MKRKKQDNYLGAYKDEIKHSSSNLEWWSMIGFFTSKEDKKHWNVKATLSEGFVDSKHFDSLSNVALFNEETNHYYDYLLRKRDYKLQSNQDKFDVRQDETYMKGTYPSYEAHIKDPENDIEIDMTLQAESHPCWVAREATDGWLPMGLGFFRYWFIPKNKISGTLKKQGKISNIEGTGYFEHVWGSFSYRNPLSLRTGFKKTISIYLRLIIWWLQNQKPHIPSSLMWSTENNPLGFDWAWAVLDNGWMIYYGNFLCWFMEGPATGLLILSKDGQNYTEFSAINFHYTKTKLAKSYDFIYPTEFEITAFHKNEKIHLRFTMTAECREYISRFPKGKHWLGFVTVEAPGTVVGYYENNGEKTPLSGKCKIEPQRQASIIGHNSLRIDIIKPPHGVGISTEIDSHYLGKKMNIHLQLIPKPTLHFACKRTKNTEKNNK